MLLSGKGGRVWVKSVIPKAQGVGVSVGLVSLRKVRVL